MRTTKESQSIIISGESGAGQLIFPTAENDTHPFDLQEKRSRPSMFYNISQNRTAPKQDKSKTVSINVNPQKNIVTDIGIVLFFS